MPAQKLITDLKKRTFSPVYLLHGEEPYYIDLVSDFIEQNVLSEAEKGFNQTIIYATKETDPLSIINNAKRYPMMSEYQVIIVKEAQNLEWDKADAVLTAYFNQPLKSSILVFCYKYKKFDKRKKIYKLIEKVGLTLESNKIYDNKVAPWITEYINKSGHKMRPEASALMEEYLGNDLSKIVNELEKLLINVPKEREITTIDIQNNIGISKDFNVFELNKALSYRDVVKANQIINYFASNPKSHPIPVVLGSLTNYFTKILKCHYAPDKSQATIAKTAGVHSFFAGEYISAMRHYNQWKTFQIIGYLREYDLKSKGMNSVNTDSGQLMKELVYKIMH
jgi:DNA polymerase-3 subunit delta